MKNSKNDEPKNDNSSRCNNFCVPKQAGTSVNQGWDTINGRDKKNGPPVDPGGPIRCFENLILKRNIVVGRAAAGGRCGG